MKTVYSHSWNVKPSEAAELQKQLRSEILLKPFNKKIKLIAGSDISFNKFSPTVYAGIVVLDARTMQIVEKVSAIMDVKFPYIPGFLSFREIPPLLKAFKKLKSEPDVIIFDGHGIAHPRRMGIAAHAGLVLGKPTIGCAKSLLTGVYKEPSLTAGSKAKLIDKKTDEQIGVVFRTKNKVKPVFISPGHLMDFDSAVHILETAVKGYRIPEPTRQAHLFVNEVRLEYLKRTQKREILHEVSHR